MIRPLALTLVALALVHSLVAVYFTNQVVAVPLNQEVAAPRMAKRAVLIVVDGLRYDTALTSGWMPELQKLAARGAAGLCMASRVTMTGVGVRSIGTGVSPGLADLLNNIESPPVDFDNPLMRLHQRGERVALVGDRPAWMSQFGRYIAIDETAPAESRMLHFMNNVDGADRLWVEHALALMARRDWDLTIVMLGGIDHASHRFTPFGEAFRKKAAETDHDLVRIVDAAGTDTTVLITSDHGAGDRGHHGSGEPAARRTPLVMTGPGIRAGVTIEARQVDIAPTLSALLGVPLPAPSEGRVLLEALALGSVDAAALEAANRRQLERYATAVAASLGRTPPTVGRDLHVVGDWLEEVRAQVSMVPLAWAVALALCAIGLLFPSLNRWPLLVVALLAGITWLGDGASRTLPLACAVASLLALAPPRRLPRPAALVALLVLELLVVFWRRQRRAFEIAVLSALGVRATLATVSLGLALLILAPLAKLLRRDLSPGAALLLLVAISAAGDTLALPIGIGAGMLAALLSADADERLPLLATVAVSLASLAVVDAQLFSAIHLDVAAPFLLALLAASTSARPLVLLAAGAGLSALLWAGAPPVAFPVGIAASLLLVTAGSAEARGLGAALVLSALARPGQVPGLIALTACALLSGRLRHLKPLHAGLLAISLRLAFFALFEGAFETNRIEVSVGYLGNPGTAHALGAALVVLKLVLPFIVCFSLVTAHSTDQKWVAGAALSFFALRVLHIVLSMTVARDTFYSPYADAGHLLFTLLFFAGAGLAALTDTAIRRWKPGQ